MPRKYHRRSAEERAEAANRSLRITADAAWRKDDIDRGFALILDAITSPGEPETQLRAAQYAMSHILKGTGSPMLTYRNAAGDDQIVETFLSRLVRTRFGLVMELVKTKSDDAIAVILGNKSKTSVERIREEASEEGRARAAQRRKDKAAQRKAARDAEQAATEAPTAA